MPYVLWLIYSVILSYAVLKALRTRRVAFAASSGLMLILVGIRPMLLLFDLDTPIPDHQFIGNYNDAMLLANLAILVWVCILVVSYSRGSQLEKLMASFIPNRAQKSHPSILMMLTLTLSGFSFLCTAVLVLQMGSISNFMYFVKIEKGAAGLYIFREIATLAAVISVIGFVATAKQQLSRLQRFIFIGAILVNLAIIYSWGNRTFVGYVFAVLVISMYYLLPNIKMSKLILIVLACAVLLQGLREGRDQLFDNARGYEGPTLEHSSQIRSLSLSMHLAEYDGLVLATRDVGTVFPYRYGEDFYNGLVSWIPRFLWAGKPSTFFIGQWFRQVYEDEKVNGWPITSIGSWYVNFSWLGVVIGAFLTGTLLRAIDNKCKTTNSWSLVVSAVIAVFVIGDGVNTNMLQAYFFLGIPLALTSLLFRRKQRLAVLSQKEYHEQDQSTTHR
ncbi:oligosaccharide repeat unit polymerase [Alginatibacterium sediminis]|uniref:Oligosaccharide repeat unit polymerase n=1 Tax=Alginatibacterium sediminis TaxID=2164068 RepID=A0A420E603_9ALTE|nr:O-antigen polymerase [Alginatibacterium sediminis]RKF13224.1 oligosaccharide repeat unit polymerase [Alginatibacterium sediminis]